MIEWIKMKKIALSLCTLALVGGCAPTIKVQAPDKPIEINLNINIEHHVKVEIDRDVEQAISNNQDIF